MGCVEQLGGGTALAVCPVEVDELGRGDHLLWCGWVEVGQVGVSGVVGKGVNWEVVFVQSPHTHS